MLLVLTVCRTVEQTSYGLLCSQAGMSFRSNPIDTLFIKNDLFRLIRETETGPLYLCIHTAC